MTSAGKTKNIGKEEDNKVKKKCKKFTYQLKKVNKLSMI